MESERNFDLLTLGQLLLRLSPPNNERLSRGDTFVKQVGGAELNVAVGVALLGLHTGIISKIPSHDMGSFMKSKIRSYGVSDDYFMYDNSPSARVGIYYYENGAYPRKPKVIYDRVNSSFYSINIDEIPEDVYTATRCFHTTGITLALSEKSRETTLEMIKRFKAAGTLVSFDVNFRANLWTGEEARECIEKILPYVDIFFCSEDTARLTFKKTGTAKEMMKSFAKEYPISIIASTQRIVHSPKRHTFGSVMYDAKKDEYYEEEPYRDIEVVDRIGSGDAYISGALYGLLSNNFDCAKAIQYGNATSAVKNTIPGDLPSSDLEEIETIIRAHNQKGPQSEMAR
ncbi:sugar kinase [Clostridium sp. MCC353]|uniref:sugar kinase n=1 Tax=Clostridium sp. MCC353 TaxID=2592646 RepID=UPI001C011229|nr:sugar kinase [Clostridium sp. MCC353]MBT9779355.1 sugar kinase [Clostridium sp. MCC353]